MARNTKIEISPQGNLFSATGDVKEKEREKNNEKKKRK